MDKLRFSQESMMPVSRAPGMDENLFTEKDHEFSITQ